jgi:hemerythrin superfamily protein/histone H3/H4
MQNIYKYTLVLLAVSSCTKKQLVLNEQTHNPDTGVVIAQSEFIGKRYATETEGTVSDCKDGVGIGVSVESTLADSSYIFNRDQEPCKQADVMFDGSLDIYARSADPSIDIIFNDKYGKLPQTHNIEKTANSAILLTDADASFAANADLATKQYDQMGLLKVDYKPLAKDDALNLQQNKFEEILKENLEKNKEIALAQARAEKRVLTDSKTTELAQQNKTLEYKVATGSKYTQLLSANLTNQSKEIQNLHAQIEALKTTKDIQSNSYEEKLALLEKRVEDFAQLSLELKRENERLALNLKQSNKTITTDLVDAENDADNARYVAMLQAAENISVDERLAKALEISQQKALQRKAQRLQTQADALAYHAQSNKVFNKDIQEVYSELQNNMQPAYEGKIARVVGVQLNDEPELANVQLLLNETDRSFDAILAEILQDVQPMVGTWKVDWKLASQNLEIRDEKWNITAETTLYDFFDYIKEKVKEIHGIDLSIEEYAETRKIVITDKF